MKGPVQLKSRPILARAHLRYLHLTLPLKTRRKQGEVALNTVQSTRRSARTAPKELAFIQIFGDDGGKILNISDSGLSFESFAPLGPARTLQFWFSLNLLERIEAMGEVVWLDSGTKVGGLRFVNPTDQVLQHIRRYSKDPRSGAGRRFLEAVAYQKTSQRDASGKGPVEISAEHSFRSTQPQSSTPIGHTTTDSAQNASLDSTDLISFQRHREVSRKRFLWGLALGLFLASTMTAAAFRFLGPKQPVALSKPAVTSVPASTDLPDRSLFNLPPAPLTPELPRNRTLASAPPVRGKDSSVSPALGANNVAVGTSARRAVLSPSAVRKSSKRFATPLQLWSAVQAGDGDAAVALADRYLRGDGVPENCLQARVLLLAASEKKNATAIKMLEQLDKTGCPANSEQ
jgi:PilZ domain-containing protein